MILNILCVILIILWAIELSYSNTIEDILPCVGWILSNAIIIFSSFITPILWVVLLIIDAFIWTACIWLNVSKKRENVEARLIAYILMLFLTIAETVIIFVGG